MNHSFITDASACVFAAIAEGMYSDSLTTPDLPPGCGEKWEIVEYITAMDAVLCAQSIGLGDRVYYGFIARSREFPTEYIAVIRGTLRVVEWIENIEAVLVQPEGVDGRVEAGFWSIFQTMMASNYRERAHSEIVRAISEIVENGARITVIGHSLGAALATYLATGLAIALRDVKPQTIVQGFFIASPRPGNLRFASFADKAIGRDNYQVVNYIRDIVPHVPVALPLFAGFSALPNERWLKPSDAMIQIRNEPLCNHHALSYAAMLDGRADLSNQPCVIGRSKP